MTIGELRSVKVQDYRIPPSWVSNLGNGQVVLVLE
jgi:hypothetical protein